MNDNTLYIIPARGGSKGIPGKNIKELGGVPLVCRTIDQARALTTDEHICVTTDSPQIRAVAEAHGLRVPFLRPAALATDQSPTRDALLHALDFYATQGHRYDTIVLLQPTSPFRTPAQIAEAVALYRRLKAGGKEPDMVVSVKPAAANPYYDIFETDDAGLLHVSKGTGTITRRQDAPQVWQYNGAIYVINTESLRREPMGAFVRKIPYMMDTASSADLDTPEDWEAAERRISAKQSSEFRAGRVLCQRPDPPHQLISS